MVLLEDLLTLILRDYVHWRRNYFPGDKILLNRSLMGQFREDHDEFSQKVSEMMAEMRRNFPFYNPRYIGHMSSDVTIPSIVGYFAGLLYNPNNVSVEAAPVTVEWEIEAASRVLRMLGYTPPPDLPDKDDDITEYYSRAARSTFGWAHICSGGTAANIEALWVARNVRYFPLSVWDVACRHKISIEVKRGDGSSTELRRMKPEQVLGLKTNESIYLLAKFVEAVRLHYRLQGLSSDALSERAWALLDESEYSLSRGTAAIFSKYPPVIFVSGAAHYSIKKAADIIGVGRANVELVAMNGKFRIDINDLRTKMLHALKKGQTPLAVIAIVGTTEEGAVDPVHQIVELREEMEKQHGKTFWLHIDAAWGGYIRTLFCPEDQDLRAASIRKISSALGISPFTPEFEVWHETVRETVISCIDEGVRVLALELYQRLAAAVKDGDIIGYWSSLADLMANFLRARGTSAPSIDVASMPPKNAKKQLREKVELLVHRIAGELGVQVDERVVLSHDFIVQWHSRFGPAYKESQKTINEEWAAEISEKLRHNFQKLEKYRDLEHSPTYLTRLRELLTDYREYIFSPSSNENLKLTIDDRMQIIWDYVRKPLVLEWNGYSRTLQAIWGKDRDVLRAFFAFAKSDSTTIDPHKLGYTPYACGMVTFQNDRVRHFILQKAPYITSVKHNAAVHYPPRHAEAVPGDPNRNRVVVESFGPFMLEGSKPGAAAAGLWLGTEMIPLTMHKHGAIIRATLLAARELHEWIVHWDAMLRKNGIEREFEFFPLVESDPDTNVVVFVVKKKTSSALEASNTLTRLIYDQFAIQTELGQRQYSYSQRFFLSKTTCDEPAYPFETLRPFFQRAGFDDDIASSYQKHGLTVLRSVVMSPYLNSATELTGQNLYREFLEDLSQAGTRALEKIRRSG